MAGSLGSKYYDIFLEYSIQLNHRDKGGLLGSLHFDLLATIHETGSIKESAEKMNISYRKAWGIIQKVEDGLGFNLLNRQRGGSHGGRTTLTEDGMKLMHALKELRGEFDLAIHDLTKKFFKKLNQ